MKIYDVFPFYNELDVLEIRLQELWNVVDCFVLVESNLTFTGKSKEYIFEKNKERFEPYLSKIKHIKVDDIPTTDDPWVREKFQRVAGQRGLVDAQPEDIVIVSDCDEIPRAELIELIKTDENNYDRYLLNVPQFNYKINFMKISTVSKHCQIVITRFKKFTDPQREREYTFFWNPKPDNTVAVEHGGWHFTSFGDTQHVLTKLQSYSHTEANVPRIIDNLNIDRMIRNKCGLDGIENSERFEYVVVDNYFPECIVNNIEKWKDMIIPNAAFCVDDLYRESDKNT